MTTSVETRAQTGFYCSTSGTYFTDKESLAEHYKSDFHKYNLKRKVAGLPPVTREWFDARKAQLSSIQSTAPVQKVWYDPLTQKKFSSENTYQAHVRSKKYQDLVKKSGNPAPEPVLFVKKQPELAQPAPAPLESNKPQPGYHIVKILGPTKADDTQEPEAEVEDDGDDSDWETASNVSEEGTKQVDKESSPDWEEWDVCRSLFDNHVSKSFEENLEYMFKNFGFYFPDAEYLKDPQGLLKYLANKLAYGHVPLYTRGDDANAKQFRSLHSVQRHMVDTCQCKMVYDDNEDEYEEFYDYSEEESADDAGKALAVADAIDELSGSLAGLELVVPGGEGGGGKVLGNRDLARYYRQGHRTEDNRQSVVVNTMLARYRSLGIATQVTGTEAEERRERAKFTKRADHKRLNLYMKANVFLGKLPKNCPY